MAFLTDQYSWNVPLILAIVAIGVAVLFLLGTISAFAYKLKVLIVKRSGFTLIAIGLASGFFYMNERLNSFLVTKMSDQTVGIGWMTKAPIEILLPTFIGVLMVGIGYVAGFIAWDRDRKVIHSGNYVKKGSAYDILRKMTVSQYISRLLVNPTAFGQYWEKRTEQTELNKSTSL